MCPEYQVVGQKKIALLLLARLVHISSGGVSLRFIFYLAIVFFYFSLFVCVFQ